MMVADEGNLLTWWPRAVFYQVYPRSFADGISDLAGLMDRLDYLRDLGIDVIWLLPYYPSPFRDCGYDISDYTVMAPEYGTLADFTRFLHEPPRAACSSWYIWRKGVSDGPPNNWASIFVGSAWELDLRTNQYLLPYFPQGAA